MSLKESSKYQIALAMMKLRNILGRIPIHHFRIQSRKSLNVTGALTALMSVVGEKEDLEYWSFAVDVDSQCWSGAGAKEISRRLVRLHADVLASPAAVATSFHGRTGHIGVLLDTHQREAFITPPSPQFFYFFCLSFI